MNKGRIDAGPASNSSQAGPFVALFGKTGSRRTEDLRPGVEVARTAPNFLDGSLHGIKLTGDE
jgi:hypothetical protein